MKNTILILAILLSSCGVGNHLEESKIQKTTIYVGKYEQSYTDGRHTIVKTSHILLKVRGNISIPDNALCYIKREPMYGMHQDIAWKVEYQALTWNGTDKEYRLVKNVKLPK